MAMIARACPEIRINVVDHNSQRIAAWNSSVLPVFEPGLEAIVAETRGRNLHFSTDHAAAIEAADLIFVAVTTPTKTYGDGAGRTIDLRYIEAVARLIAAHSRRDKIIVEMSSIPVKTADTISTILGSNSNGPTFRVISNPVFISKGSAVNDLIHPERVLIGGDRAAVDVLREIYARWVPRERIITTNLWSAELSKLVANAFLAQRLSSINSISALCEVTGADVDEVAHAIGYDSRIGSRFLKASLGYGGPTFQKDVLCLAYLCESFRLPEVAAYWTQVAAINDFQTRRFANRITRELFNSASGKKIAVLGFAFKKDTNDVRHSPAAVVCRQLVAERARLCIYDPQVTAETIRGELPGDSVDTQIEIAQSARDACRGAHAIVIATDWDEFKTLDFELIFSEMTKPAFVFDGRNILELEALKKIGFRAFGVGK
jgi:UDPglucose 6-dehydrogenase